MRTPEKGASTYLSFAGGIEGAVHNAPHPVIAYVKGTQLIFSDLGDRGSILEATWQLQVWIPKVTGEMGYRLLFAGLVFPEIKDRLEALARMLAREANLDLVWSPEWQG